MRDGKGTSTDASIDVLTCRDQREKRESRMADPSLKKQKDVEDDKSSQESSKAQSRIGDTDLENSNVKDVVDEARPQETDVFCMHHCCICGKECSNEGYILDDNEHVVCDKSHEIEGRCKMCNESLFGLDLKKEEKTPSWQNFLIHCEEAHQCCQIHRRVALAKVAECDHFLCSRCLSEMKCRREDNQNGMITQGGTDDLCKCSAVGCYSVIPASNVQLFLESDEEILGKERSQLAIYQGNEACSICSQRPFCEMKCQHPYCMTCLIRMLNDKSSLLLPYEQKMKRVVFCPVLKCCSWILLTDVYTFVTDSLMQNKNKITMLEEGKTCHILTCGSNAVVQLPCLHSFCIGCSNVLMREDPIYVFKHAGQTFNVMECPVKGCQNLTCLEFILQSYEDYGVPLDNGDKKPDEGPTVSSLKVEQNIGMTCYCKSILQVLSRTPGLLNQLRPYIDSRNKEVDCLIISALYDILTELNMDESDDRSYKTVSNEKISSLINNVYKKDNSFGSEFQNDSHAFLIALLKLIDDEMKQTDNGRLSLFDGQFCTKIRCARCSKTEKKFQKFRSIRVPLTKTGSKHGVYYVEESLMDLTRDEIFDKGQVPCKSCLVDNDEHNIVMIKKKVIHKCPEVLILQAGTATERIRNWEKKLRCCLREKMDSVHFPVYLSLQQLHVTQESADIGAYRLFGVVMHSGIHRAGHYYACVKNKYSNWWRYCDGSFETVMDEQEVRHAPNAYILFYAKT